MRIAVLSDIHDNIWNLERALNDVLTHGCERILFAGDLCAPFSLAQLADAGLPLDVVFGNNDGDTFLISQVAANRAGVTLHGQIAELEIADRRIAMNHYPQIARSLAASGRYDAVFFGHNHEASQEEFPVGGMGDSGARPPAPGQRTSVLLANPGEVMGRLGSPSWAIWTPETNEFEFIPIDHVPGGDA